MTKLQEQFEEETGMVAYGRGINCKIYSDAYVEWLEAKAGQHETIVSGTAAGEWQTGEPEESGRYLVEYQQGERIKKVFVMDYDAFEERWLTHATEAEVLRWAKINSEYQ